jgi:hypothetical protein
MGRGHLDDLSIDGRILHCIIKKEGGRTCSGFMWLRTGTSDILLTMAK